MQSVHYRSSLAVRDAIEHGGARARHHWAQARISGTHTHTGMQAAVCAWRQMGKARSRRIRSIFQDTTTVVYLIVLSGKKKPPGKSQRKKSNNGQLEAHSAALNRRIAQHAVGSEHDPDPPTTCHESTKTQSQSRQPHPHRISARHQMAMQLELPKRSSAHMQVDTRCDKLVPEHAQARLRTLKHMHNQPAQTAQTAQPKQHERHKRHERHGRHGRHETTPTCSQLADHRAGRYHRRLDVPVPNHRTKAANLRRGAPVRHERVRPAI